MSLMKRVRDISVATLNDRLERSEDPVRLIDRYLSEQYEQIRQTEKLHAQCMQHASQLKAQCDGARELAAKREEQAALALKAGEEELARLALQEKLLHDEKIAQFEPLYQQAMETVAELAAQLEALRKDYREVYHKRQYYVARMQAAQLQRRLNERRSFGGDLNSDRVFSRLEDQLSRMELESRTLAEVRRMGQELLYEAGSTVKSLLDDELARLKQKIDQEGAAGK